MKKWKILVMVPYMLIAAWIAFWWLSFAKLGLISIILVPVFTIWGIAVAVIYTVILGIALLIRWIVKKHAGKKSSKS